LSGLDETAKRAVCANQVILTDDLF